MNHTLEPWKIGEDLDGTLAVLLQSDGKVMEDGYVYRPVPICRIGQGYNRSPDEAAANARLIAAAPELLAVCRLTLVYLREWHNGETGIPVSGLVQAIALIETLQETIAKATGGEPCK